MNNSNECNTKITNQTYYLDFYRMKIEKLVNNKLILRYEKPISFHDVKIINDMIFNEKTHFVEIFKEFLIYDDYNEFLKRFYNTKEISNKLPIILNFYEKYSKIYANYTVIPERKYMYKNIKRKQKVIDQMQNNFYDDLLEYDEIDNTLKSQIFNSLEMNYINSISMTISSNKSKINTSQTDNGAIELINKIDYFEKEALKIKNDSKKKINKSNKIINNKNEFKNQIDPIKEKLKIDKRIKSKIKIKLLEKKKINLFSLNNSKSKNKILFKDFSKNDKKIILSTNNNSPIKKISPTSSTFIQKKNILMKKKLNFKQENIQLETFKNNNSKILLSNKIDKIKNNLNSLINKKSKSISKGKNNQKYISNIINDLNEGISNINNNNYTRNDFFDTNFNSSKNVFKNQNIYFNKKIITNDNSINNTNNYSNKKISKLNLRKIFRKNILGLESLSDRQTNYNKKWFNRNHFFQKNNSSNNEIYSNSSMKFLINDNSKIMNKQFSYFNLTNLKPNRVIKTNNNNNLSNINIKRINSNTNLEYKLKLKNFNKLTNKKI